MRTLLHQAVICAALGMVQSCAVAPSSSSSGEHAAVTGARLQLESTNGFSDVRYRLTRATFIIRSLDGTLLEPLEVASPDDERPGLDVPLEPGSYEVELKKGWELSASIRGSSFFPIDATLRSLNPAQFYVFSQESSRVRFEFETGESELELGVNVEDNGRIPIPDGYDGIILTAPDAADGFEVLLRYQGSFCCYRSPSEAEQSFIGQRLYVPSELRSAPSE